MRAYKFLDEKYGLKDITERRVKVSTFADMNDPFELIGSRWSHIGAEDALIAHSTSEYGAMCLSKNCTDPLLWAHYADKHRGICLGLDIPDDPNVVHAVIYADERELQDPYLLLKTVASLQLEVAQSAVMPKLLLKYKGWQYEDEVRLLKRLEKGPTFCLFDDEDFALKQVILGLRCTVSKRTVLNRLRGYNHEVEILKATLSPDRFQIIATRV
jgi:Protein of unknown function (DUF2971)